MQLQAPPQIRAPRLDGRSLAAAALCVLALFFDVLGWLLAIAGVVLLRRAAFGRSAKWLLGTLAIAPKVLFLGVRSLDAPPGLSFPIEPRTLATSSSLWASCMLLAAFGLFLLLLPRWMPKAPNAPLEPRSFRSLLVPALGLLPVALAAVLLLGLTQDFHRIDDAGAGQWALHHDARGTVAVFAPAGISSIEAEERRRSRSGRDYSVRVTLAGGRTFSLTTGAAAALDELRKFAATANLPPGTVRIRRRAGNWTNGASGFSLQDCAGTYELADQSGPSRSIYEFWIEGGRLAGRETETGPGGRHVRVLRNIKLSDTGEMEFQPASFVEASQQEKGAVSFSLRWSPLGETGRFVRGGFETGTQKFRKR